MQMRLIFIETQNKISREYISLKQSLFTYLSINYDNVIYVNALFIINRIIYVPFEAV